MNITKLRAFALMIPAIMLPACGNDKAPQPKKASAETSLSSGESDASDGPTDDALSATDSADGGASDETINADGSDDGEGEDGESEGEDGQDDEDDVDQANGSASDLKFTSTKRDDNDFFIAIKVGKKAWTQQMWPKEGESIEFPDACVGKTTKIEVKVVHEDGQEFTTGSQLKVDGSGSEVSVAFEELAGADTPDDLIGKLTCDKGKLSVK